MSEDAIYTLVGYAIALLVFALILRAVLRYVRQTMHPTRPFWPTVLLFAGAGFGAVYVSGIVAVVALLPFFDVAAPGFTRLGIYVMVPVFFAIMFWGRSIIRSPLGTWVGDKPAAQLARALREIIQSDEPAAQIGRALRELVQKIRGL